LNHVSVLYTKGGLVEYKKTMPYYSVGIVKLKRGMFFFHIREQFKIRYNKV